MLSVMCINKYGKSSKRKVKSKKVKVRNRKSENGDLKMKAKLLKPFDLFTFVFLLFTIKA
jgi:hypothetical protein